MSTFLELWANLKSKKYREHFVGAQVKRAIPAQIRVLMADQKLTQAQLAGRASVSQGTISRAMDMSYGDLSLNTVVKIAAGLDVAFIGRFVPFSELTRWFDQWTEDTMRVDAYPIEAARFTKLDDSSAPPRQGTVVVKFEIVDRAIY